MRVESKNAILEMISRGYPIERIEVVEGGDAGKKTEHIRDLAQKHHIPIVERARDKRGRKVNTAGFVAVSAIVQKPESPSLRQILHEIDKKDVTLLVFREVQYAINLGAILRTSFAAGVDAVILPSVKGQDVDSEIARISMGASFFVPTLRMSVLSALSDISKAGVKLVGADMSGSISYFQANLRGSVAFVFGSESEGLSEPIKDRCDEIVRIPMKNDFESLNVGVSAALVLFEKIRQDQQHL